MMNAVEYRRYGEPEVLRIARVPRPVPSAGQVLVKVQASSINGGELAKRRGQLQTITGGRFPKPTGVDFIGVVAQLGEGVTEIELGNAVWGTVSEKSGVGSQAEYVAVPTTRISAAPRGPSPLDAVTLLAGGTTALAALRDVVGLQRGERLLVRGAAGGVGSVAVQIGAMLGAHVTGLARASSADFVREMGAQNVIDYRARASEVGTHDVVFDTRGSELRQYRALLSRRGRMVTIAPDFERLLPSLAYLAYSAVHGKRRVRLFLGNPPTSLLEDVAAATESGLLRPVRAATLPLERIADAHRKLESGGVHGKVVLDIG